MGRGKLFAAMAVGLVSVSCGGGDDAPREYPGMGAAPAFKAAKTSVTMQEVTGSGDLLKSIIAASDGLSPAGPDGLYFTGDDHIEGYYETRPLDNNEGERWIEVSGAGSDGQWYTEDDELQQYRETITLDSPTRKRDYYADDPGSDGQWFTADDRPDTGYGEKILDDNGQTIQETNFESGPDSLRFTDDDILAALSRYEDTPKGRAWVARYLGEASGDIYAANSVSYYKLMFEDSDGRQVELLFDIGEDNGLAFDADDTPSSFTASSFDSQGRLARTEIGCVGIDKTFGTGDDALDYVQYWRYQSDGSVLYEEAGDLYGCPGFRNGMAPKRTRTRTDSTGREIENTTFFDRGPDGVWLTEDDVVSYQTLTTFDGGRRSVREAEYAGAGRDGSWLTADDELEWYTVTNFDSDGNATLSRSFGATGEDQQWFTEDDVPISRSVFQPGFFGGDEGVALFYRSVSPAGAPQEERLEGYQVQRFTAENGVEIAEYLWFGAPGADSQWFTQDDELVSHDMLVTQVRAERSNDPL